MSCYFYGAFLVTNEIRWIINEWAWAANIGAQTTKEPTETEIESSQADFVFHGRFLFSRRGGKSEGKEVKAKNIRFRTLATYSYRPRPDTYAPNRWLQRDPVAETIPNIKPWKKKDEHADSLLGRHCYSCGEEKFSIQRGSNPAIRADWKPVGRNLQLCVFFIHNGFSYV